MIESETAEILNGRLGATIHGKIIKEILEIINLNEVDSYMQDLATRTSNAIEETKGSLSKMRLTRFAFFVIQNFYIKTEQ
ncbi:hypothetical protein [Lactobacillus rizhaonensis]|uniref:hypothetical protein n=1 Tax=Lactobacillus rizhaonensis TaxID=3082863 RepID=UPI0030C65EAF